MRNSARLASEGSFVRYPLPPLPLYPTRDRRLATTRHRQSPRSRQRSAAPPFYQQLDRQRITSREANRMDFILLVKLLLAFSPLLLTTQWYLATTSERYHQAVANSEAVHHILIENQAALESLRNRLSSPERIRNMAAEKLSLYLPALGQVEIF